jgi:expansin (peptidoglycan-binding protein)
MITKTIILLAIVLFAGVVDARDTKTHSGWGTAYSGAFQINKTGRNACQFDVRKLDRHWNIYYAAMNGADWRKAGGNRGGRSNACGRCIEVKGVKGQTTKGHHIKPVIARVVDECPSWACKPGSVDFSSVALKAITGYSWDKKRITWKYVDCPTASTNFKPVAPTPPSPKPTPTPKPVGPSDLEQSILDQLED